MATQTVRQVEPAPMWAVRAPRLLAGRWVPPVAIGLALMLVLPCLWNGRVGDDYMHMARVDPQLHVPAFA